MAHDDGSADDLAVSVPDRRRRRLRSGTLALVLLGVGIIGVVAWKQIKPVVDSRRYASVPYEVPVAPRLQPTDGETLYRIDPTQSSLTYAVDEHLGGAQKTAKGVTNAIAGDLAISDGDLAASRVGDIVVNVEQFTSDNNLRDARLRQDYLASHEHPLATFSVDHLDGLEGPFVEGKPERFAMEGRATVKAKTAPATWKVIAVVKDGKLTATATTTAKLSSFDAGPISIAGLVSTSDDVKLTLRLTALDPSDHDIATTLAAPVIDERAAARAPSFKRVVQPIIESNCASCHNTGGIGAHEVPMDTAGDVADISDGIKTVTQAGYMPPWPASDKGVPLAHVARLSDADLAALAAWSDAGGPLDEPASTEVTLTPEAAELLPRKDETLRIPAYTGSLKNTNDYRCFVLDPKLTEDKFLTGYTFEGDQVDQLHHAQVFQISAEQMAASKDVAGKDGQPGWGCYGGPGLQGRHPDDVPGEQRKPDVGFAGQSNLVAGWVPGQNPVIFPQHSGIKMHAGDALVLQIHYHYDGDEAPVADSSGLSLQLDPVDGETRQLRVINPLAPVEIPCAPKDAGAPLCDRDASLADNAETYGPSGALIEPGLLLLCGHSPEELTKGFDGSVARSSCLLKVPQDGTIVGAMGHMHTLGKSIRLTLSPDSPDEQVLLDIPNWSFDWQMNYELAKPVRVTAGQQIRLDCAWDRSIDPLRDPKYIVFAEGTEDEMCFATYSLISDD